MAVFSLCFTAFRDAVEMAPDAQRMVAEVDQGSATPVCVVAASPADPSAWARPVRFYEAGRPRSSSARSHHPPEVTTADAVAEVQRLESAIAVLGESNLHAGPLLKSLQVAKSRSRVRGWQTGSRRARVSSNGPSAAWFERRKFSREPEIRKTCAFWRLRLPKVVTVAGGAHRAQSTLHSNPRGRRFAEADRRVVQGTRTEGSKNLRGEWFADVVQDLSQMPPMPSCLQELQGWMSDSNCELRNALEHGDVASIVKLGILLSQGAGLLLSMSGDMMDGKSRHPRCVQ